MSDAVVIPIDRIIAASQYQPRDGGIVESHVRLLMESDPATWPPPIVSPDGKGGYDIIDGFHRHEAGTRLGLTHLRCIVQEGAGYPEAVSANLRHGLPLGISDRKEAARWWAENEPDLSYREIGRRVGLSDKTVKWAVETAAAESPQSRPPSGPLDRWLHQTYRLESPPSSRDVKADIDAYAEEDRAGVASFYAAIGQALVDASAPYMKGR